VSVLRLATRGSALARWQAQRAATLLGVDCELVIVSTTGDQRGDVPIWEMGGNGVFVKEVQDAVLDGRADVAVHSAKDLPSGTPPGLLLAAVPERADPRDALIGSTFEGLRTGARIGTGSVRRRAQLAARRPDLVFGTLRGNIETRVKKAAEFDAVVVAYAAVERLGLQGKVTDVLDPDVMLPQVAQGALALECREDDDDTRALLARADDNDAHAAVIAERVFLGALAGGCNVPCGALWRDGSIDALLASPDGRIVIRATASDDDPSTAGQAVAARVLDDCGGRALLEL